jgi:hypothetical protein
MRTAEARRLLRLRVIIAAFVRRVPAKAVARRIGTTARWVQMEYSLLRRLRHFAFSSVIHFVFSACRSLDL